MARHHRLVCPKSHFHPPPDNIRRGEEGTHGIALRNGHHHEVCGANHVIAGHAAGKRHNLDLVNNHLWRAHAGHCALYPCAICARLPVGMWPEIADRNRRGAAAQVGADDETPPRPRLAAHSHAVPAAKHGLDLGRVFASRKQTLSLDARCAVKSLYGKLFSDQARNIGTGKHLRLHFGGHRRDGQGQRQGNAEGGNASTEGASHLTRCGHNIIPQ